MWLKIVKRSIYLSCTWQIFRLFPVAVLYYAPDRCTLKVNVSLPKAYYVTRRYKFPDLILGDGMVLFLTIDTSNLLSFIWRQYAVLWIQIHTHMLFYGRPIQKGQFSELLTKILGKSDFDGPLRYLWREITIQK